MTLFVVVLALCLCKWNIAFFIMIKAITIVCQKCFPSLVISFLRHVKKLFQSEEYFWKKLSLLFTSLFEKTNVPSKWIVIPQWNEMLSFLMHDYWYDSFFLSFFIFKWQFIFKHHLTLLLCIEEFFSIFSSTSAVFQWVQSFSVIYQFLILCSFCILLECMLFCVLFRTLEMMDLLYLHLSFSATKYIFRL